MVEGVEAELVDLGGDLGAEAAEGVAFFGDDAAAGFLNRVDDHVDVERLDGAGVDHFDVDSFFFEDLGSLESKADLAQVGDESDVFAFWHSSQATDPGLNVSQYKSKEADAALDDNQRKALYEQVQCLIAEDAVNVFLYNGPYLVGMRNTVHNWWTNLPIPDIDVTRVYKTK